MDAKMQDCAWCFLEKVSQASLVTSETMHMSTRLFIWLANVKSELKLLQHTALSMKNEDLQVLTITVYVGNKLKTRPASLIRHVTGSLEKMSMKE